KLTREVTARTLVLDLTGIGPIDSAATDCLRQLAARQRSRGGELHLIGLDERLLASIAKDGLLDEIGAVIRRDEESNHSSRHYPLSKQTSSSADRRAAPTSNKISSSGEQFP